jgi:uncharacterized membrane protein YjjP (DUF1212 family)
MAEGAVLTVRHIDGPAYHDTIRVGPELTRLDLVSKATFLVNRIQAGVGTALFAVGFAPSVQQTWSVVAATALLGTIMGVLFIAAELLAGLRVLLPIVGTLVVAVIAFELLHAQNAPGGPVLLMIPRPFILIPGAGGAADPDNSDSSEDGADDSE